MVEVTLGREVRILPFTPFSFCDVKMQRGCFNGYMTAKGAEITASKTRYCTLCTV